MTYNSSAYAWVSNASMRGGRRQSERTMVSAVPTGAEDLRPYPVVIKVRFDGSLDGMSLDSGLETYYDERMLILNTQRLTGAINLGDFTRGGNEYYLTLRVRVHSETLEWSVRTAGFELRRDASSGCLHFQNKSACDLSGVTLGFFNDFVVTATEDAVRFYVNGLFVSAVANDNIPFTYGGDASVDVNRRHQSDAAVPGEVIYESIELRVGEVLTPERIAELYSETPFNFFRKLTAAVSSVYNPDRTLTTTVNETHVAQPQGYVEVLYERNEDGTLQTSTTFETTNFDPTFTFELRSTARTVAETKNQRFKVKYRNPSKGIDEEVLVDGVDLVDPSAPQASSSSLPPYARVRWYVTQTNQLRLFTRVNTYTEGQYEALSAVTFDATHDPAQLANAQLSVSPPLSGNAAVTSSAEGSSVAVTLDQAVAAEEVLLGELTFDILDASSSFAGFLPTLTANMLGTTKAVQILEQQHVETSHTVSGTSVAVSIELRKQARAVERFAYVLWFDSAQLALDDPDLPSTFPNAANLSAAYSSEAAPSGFDVGIEVFYAAATPQAGFEADTLTVQTPSFTVRRPHRLLSSPYRVELRALKYFDETEVPFEVSNWSYTPVVPYEPEYVLSMDGQQGDALDLTIPVVLTKEPSEALTAFTFLVYAREGVDLLINAPSGVVDAYVSASLGYATGREVSFSGSAFTGEVVELFQIRAQPNPLVKNRNVEPSDFFVVLMARSPGTNALRTPVPNTPTFEYSHTVHVTPALTEVNDTTVSLNVLLNTDAATAAVTARVWYDADKLVFASATPIAGVGATDRGDVAAPGSAPFSYATARAVELTGTSIASLGEGVQLCAVTLTNPSKNINVVYNDLFLELVSHTYQTATPSYALQSVTEFPEAELRYPSTTYLSTSLTADYQLDVVLNKSTVEFVSAFFRVLVNAERITLPGGSAFGGDPSRFAHLPWTSAQFLDVTVQAAAGDAQLTSLSLGTFGLVKAAPERVLVTEADYHVEFHGYQVALGQTPEPNNVRAFLAEREPFEDRPLFYVDLQGTQPSLYEAKLDVTATLYKDYNAIDAFYMFLYVDMSKFHADSVEFSSSPGVVIGPGVDLGADVYYPTTRYAVTFDRNLANMAWTEQELFVATLSLVDPEFTPAAFDITLQFVEYRAAHRNDVYFNKAFFATKTVTWSGVQPEPGPVYVEELNLAVTNPLCYIAKAWKTGGRRNYLTGAFSGVEEGNRALGRGGDTNLIWLSVPSANTASYVANGHGMFLSTGRLTLDRTHVYTGNVDAACMLTFRSVGGMYTESYLLTDASTTTGTPMFGLQRTADTLAVWFDDATTSLAAPIDFTDYGITFVAFARVLDNSDNSYSLKLEVWTVTDAGVSASVYEQTALVTRASALQATTNHVRVEKATAFILQANWYVGRVDDSAASGFIQTALAKYGTTSLLPRLHFRVVELDARHPGLEPGNEFTGGPLVIPNVETGTPFEIVRDGTGRAPTLVFFNGHLALRFDGGHLIAPLASNDVLWKSALKEGCMFAVFQVDAASDVPDTMLGYHGDSAAHFGVGSRYGTTSSLNAVVNNNGGDATDLNQFAGATRPFGWTSGQQFIYYAEFRRLDSTYPADQFLLFVKLYNMDGTNYDNFQQSRSLTVVAPGGWDFAQQLVVGRNVAGVPNNVTIAHLSYYVDNFDATVIDAKVADLSARWS